jgi:hypothetical protein
VLGPPDDRAHHERILGRRELGNFGQRDSHAAVPALPATKR